MKRFLIVVGCIVVVFSLCMLNLISVGTHGEKKKWEVVEKSLSKNFKITVDSIYTYHGSTPYYMITYEKKGVSYVGVVDDRNQLVISIEQKRLKDPKPLILKDDDVVTLGYEDGFVYEVKANRKGMLVYSYYDAETLLKVKEVKL